MFTSGSGTREGGLQDQASHFMDKREWGAGGKSRHWLRSCFVSGSGLPRGSPQGITLSLLPGSSFQLEGDSMYLAEFLLHWKLSVKWLVLKSTLYYFKANFDKIFQTSLHDSVKRMVRRINYERTFGTSKQNWKKPQQWQQQGSKGKIPFCCSGNGSL